MGFLIEYLKVFGISMVPVLELRGALILAAADGLDPVISYIVCVFGNLLPVPFLILFVRPIFEWMRTHASWMKRIVEKLEAKAADKSDVIKKYEMLGLFILVAAVLGMRLKNSLPVIALGVMAAGLIMTLGAFGIVGVLANFV